MFNPVRPTFEETVDRSDGQPVGEGAGDGGESGGAAGVDGKRVEGDGRTIAEDDVPVGEVEPGDRGLDELGCGESAERSKFDVGFVGLVVPGDEAGQHAGVGGFGGRRDEGESEAWQGLHAEAFQDGDMRVPPTEEHEFVLEGYVDRHSVEGSAEFARRPGGRCSGAGVSEAPIGFRPILGQS